MRVAMTRNGGTMADPGSVSYLFSRKGVVTLDKDGLTEDDVLTAVLDAGAEEVNDLATLSKWSPNQVIWSRCAPRCKTRGLTTNRPKPVSAVGQCAGGCRWRPQGVQARRRSGRQRRRAERVDQCRRVRRGVGGSRRGVRGRRSAAPPKLISSNSTCSHSYVLAARTPNGLDAPIALGDLCLSLPRTPKRSRIGLGPRGVRGAAAANTGWRHRLVVSVPHVFDDARLSRVEASSGRGATSPGTPWPHRAPAD
ncbi:hypothetical protein BZL29_8507 [Mycobacterium kansasii]|uniref:TACO1/YebC-like second and third domain-containing protein n=1 Tax=Mycobacterium kansasii TaxID=1768 RepID=A0A1V3W9H4_MYCKA|nr:hypothetical protein BZL29_8507 [Mycobacterium kansasii]